MTLITPLSLRISLSATRVSRTRPPSSYYALVAPRRGVLGRGPAGVSATAVASSRATTSVLIGLGVVPLKLSHRDDCHRARVPSTPAALIDAYAPGQLQPHESCTYASRETCLGLPQDLSRSAGLLIRLRGPLGAAGEASEASWPLSLCARASVDRHYVLRRAAMAKGMQ